MKSIEFRYFRYPRHFALRTEDAKPCSICKNEGIWLDGCGFYGSATIECICDTCLSEGKLQALNIETNEAFYGTAEQQTEIIFRTPALPTWQDRNWPFRDGDYCVFEKIASKLDFADKAEFISSFSDEDQQNSDLSDIWERYLSDKRITSIRDGNYDISIYLFTRNGRKHCTWDAS